MRNKIPRKHGWVFPRPLALPQLRAHVRGIASWRFSARFSKTDSNCRASGSRDHGLVWAGYQPDATRPLRRSPTNESAWEQFVQLYGGHIATWCRSWGLQEADAEDVTQATLLRLVKAMQSFEYDSTRLFRGWLKTVTYHVWQDLVRTHRKMPAGKLNAGADPFESVAARDELAGAIEAAYDRELFDLAAGRVRLRVQPNTWEAFRLTAVEGVPATVAAERLKMQLTTVYKARNNVQKMLREEVRYLEERPT